MAISDVRREIVGFVMAAAVRIGAPHSKETVAMRNGSEKREREKGKN